MFKFCTPVYIYQWSVSIFSSIEFWFWEIVKCFIWEKIYNFVNLNLRHMQAHVCLWENSVCLHKKIPENVKNTVLYYFIIIYHLYLFSYFKYLKFQKSIFKNSFCCHQTFLFWRWKAKILVIMFNNEKYNI